uniref:carboxypeptidase regulatory-like domain-containing protein n=1 Tax=Cupriavidus yeoncheonensis TaxID=1462994 RepID=UPI003F4930F6
MKRSPILRGLAVVLAIGGCCQLALASLPVLTAAQHAGPVTYLSGGVGLDESQAMKDAMHNYRLVLEFARKTAYGNEYLAGVPVKITDADGKKVLEASANGPFMLVSLPPGRYTVAASYDNETEQRTVRVRPDGMVKQFFVWQM